MGQDLSWEPYFRYLELIKGKWIMNLYPKDGYWDFLWQRTPICISLYSNKFLLSGGNGFCDIFQDSISKWFSAVGLLFGKKGGKYTVKTGIRLVNWFLFYFIFFQIWVLNCSWKESNLLIAEMYVPIPYFSLNSHLPATTEK